MVENEAVRTLKEELGELQLRTRQMNHEIKAKKSKIEYLKAVL